MHLFWCFMDTGQMTPGGLVERLALLHEIGETEAAEPQTLKIVPKGE